jgi:hypothetical protein
MASSARIDRQPEHKTPLQTLAVIGRESSLGLIRQGRYSSVDEVLRRHRRSFSSAGLRRVTIPLESPPRLPIVRAHRAASRGGAGVPGADVKAPELLHQAVVEFLFLLPLQERVDRLAALEEVRFRHSESCVYACVTISGSRLFHAFSAALTLARAVSSVNGGVIREAAGVV